jgi:drug/metabolite transporter (DMT)-like permease
MKEAYGYLLIAASFIIWGTSGIFGKLAFGYEINPVTLIALRLLISSVTILIPVSLFKRELLKIQKRDLPQFLILGVLVTALQRVIYFYAVDLTTVTIAVVLFQTHPIFITLYASLFSKEKAASSTILAMILTFSGATLVAKAYEFSWLRANLIGVIFGMTSSILFALYFLVIRGLRRSYTNWTLILYGETIGAITLAPIVSSNIFSNNS